MPFWPPSWIFHSCDNNEALPCSSAYSSGSIVLKYTDVINGLYDVFYVKFSLGHFDPHGHQSYYKIFKTPQAPPGEIIYFVMILSIFVHGTVGKVTKLHSILARNDTALPIWNYRWVESTQNGVQGLIWKKNWKDKIICAEQKICQVPADKFKGWSNIIEVYISKKFKILLKWAKLEPNQLLFNKLTLSFHFIYSFSQHSWNLSSDIQ